MRNLFSALMVLSLCSCSGLWTTYQIVEDMASDNGSDMSVVQDMQIVSDLAVEKCAAGVPYYLQEGVANTLVACCSGSDPAANASNIQTTIKDSQDIQKFSSTSMTIRFSCAGTDTAKIDIGRVDANNISLFATITKNTTIDGTPLAPLVDNPSLAVSFRANGLSRFFAVSSGSLTLRNLRLAGGKAKDFPGGIPLSITKPAAAGGSIISAADVTLDRVAISDSVAEAAISARGGAIFMSGGTLTLNNSIIYFNRTADPAMQVAKDVPFQGGAITVINGSLKMLFSSVISNRNMLYQTSATPENRGIIDVNLVVPNPKYVLSIDRSIIVNQKASLSPTGDAADNVGLVIGCVNGSTTMLSIMNTVIDSAALSSCSGATLPSGMPIPNQLATTNAVFINPLSLPPPTAVTSNGFDTTFRSAVSAQCNGELDFFGVARPKGLCMPGAVSVP